MWKVSKNLYKMYQICIDNFTKMKNIYMKEWKGKQNEKLEKMYQGQF